MGASSQPAAAGRSKTGRSAVQSIIRSVGTGSNAGRQVLSQPSTRNCWEKAKLLQIRSVPVVRIRAGMTRDIRARTKAA